MRVVVCQNVRILPGLWVGRVGAQHSPRLSAPPPASRTGLAWKAPGLGPASPRRQRSPHTRHTCSLSLSLVLHFLVQRERERRKGPFRRERSDPSRTPLFTLIHPSSSKEEKEICVRKSESCPASSLCLPCPASLRVHGSNAAPDMGLKRAGNRLRGARRRKLGRPPAPPPHCVRPR